MSTPLRWDEVDEVHPDELTLATLPARIEAGGDPWEGMNDDPQSLEPFLEMHERDRAERPHGRALAARLPEAARRAAAGRAEPGEEG